MNGREMELPVVVLPGLQCDSLGRYLAALGVFRALADRWPAVRAAWNEGLFSIVGGPENMNVLVEALDEVAERGNWVSYARDWYGPQKESTKTHSATPLANWLSKAAESDLEIAVAHIVPSDVGLSFNALLGTGGNAGKRSFSIGWRLAVRALTSCEKAERIVELRLFLHGEPANWTEAKLNAASWFSDANKLYNSGQRAYKDGLISPWAMALACEGLVFFAGGPSRRLGSGARTRGAFPFVTGSPASPEEAGEAGHDRAEVWAPIWRRPMTVVELKALFARGRAEIHGRGAVTPAAFAVAARGRGVDAGIEGFRRFALGQTTSAQTFEARYEGIVQVGSGSDVDGRTSNVLERVLDLVDTLPADRKKGKEWRFVGLRGKIESAITRFASRMDTESACQMLDAVTASLDRIDRNTVFRKKRVSWEPLPANWLSALFRESGMGLEVRLAFGLVASFPKDLPFALYRFGVEVRGRRFEHPEIAPVRWVWGGGPLDETLSRVLWRWLLDWDEAGGDGASALRRAWPTLSSEDVRQWLAMAVDEALLRKWISRLALFDWSFVPSSVASLSSPGRNLQHETPETALLGLLQPLFDERPLYTVSSVAKRRDLLPLESGARTPKAARLLYNYVRNGNLGAAVSFAGSRYAMANSPLAKMHVPWRLERPNRLLSAMLLPISDRERSNTCDCWLRPQRDQQGVIFNAQ